MRIFGGLVLVLVLLAGCDVATSLLLELDGASTLTSLDLSVALDGGSTVTRTLTLAGRARPWRAVIELPDAQRQITIDATAHDIDGSSRHVQTVVTSQAHRQLTVPLALGGSDGDGGVPGGDLATPTVPVPRLIANAFYTDSSGATYRSSAGMSHNGFEVPTAGIVDGDLVIFIASVDNGSDTLWPNPIAPGFVQLVQQFYGNDGETYVAAWKVASGEPATYSGLYGSGIGSSSATISLIAVSGANATTPINAYLASYQLGAGMSPVIGSSVGVTTTVPNCLVLYASGADWLGQTGTNTFMLPSMYTSLTQIGDRGGTMWDWTSQMVGYTTQANAGATGTITGSLLGTYNATAWTVIIAVAPR